MRTFIAFTPLGFAGSLTLRTLALGDMGLGVGVLWAGAT